LWPHTPLAPTEVCRADYARSKETVEEFLAEVQTSIDVASCDVAGPGINGRVKITDLLWASDEATLTTAWFAVNSSAIAMKTAYLTNSRTETFAALKLEVNSWRWKGVPFYIRAGKCLPTTCTEIVGKFHKPPTLIPDRQLVENRLRLRLSPEITIAMGMMNLSPDAAGITLQTGENVSSHSSRADEMDACERVLGAAMDGDSTLFAREDYVEEAWRIVEPILKKNTPVYQYSPETWGPQEVGRLTPLSGWNILTKRSQSWSK
jgi:glucose-6-phosphate dehydrogenase-like protein